jgi:hypothetical protein
VNTITVVGVFYFTLKRPSILPLISKVSLIDKLEECENKPERETYKLQELT